jgi:ring-1,2-phenylacetyl-CoA epoxidase subunit PaaC
VSRTAYALRLGDDALVAAQRLTQWCTNAPQLEEDVALANIALDLLGQARALLSHAGELEGEGRDEDALAFLRDEHEITNVQLVELPNGDFAFSVARMLLFATYQHLLYQALASSTDPVLAGIAAKAVKETAYHREYAAAWTRRLGDGTDLSHTRMQRGLDDVWPYGHDLFAPDPLGHRAAGQGWGVDQSTLREPWLAALEPVLETAGLRRPADGWAPTGGREGVHTEAFGYLVTEMQALHRAHAAAGARW